MFSGRVHLRFCKNKISLEAFSAAVWQGCDARECWRRPTFTVPKIHLFIKMCSVYVTRNLLTRQTRKRGWEKSSHQYTNCPIPSPLIIRPSSEINPDSTFKKKKLQTCFKLPIESFYPLKKITPGLCRAMRLHAWLLVIQRRWQSLFVD